MYFMRRLGYQLLGAGVLAISITLSLPGRVLALDKNDFGFDDADKLGLTTQKDGVDIAIDIVRWALGLLGLAAVIMIIYGGYQWLTAGGNDSQVENAKKTLRAAVIGLAIVMLSYAISILVFNVIDQAIQ